MYRDAAKTDEDHQWLSTHSVRYDITVIPPVVLGGEFVKPKGHSPPDNPAGIGYPELYEVIDGIAHFHLQKKTLDDVALAEFKQGDIIFIPRVWPRNDKPLP